MYLFIADVEQMAIDWLTGNFYFVEHASDKVFVCNRAGDTCVTILQLDLLNPKGIALDPLMGWVKCKQKVISCLKAPNNFLSCIFYSRAKITQDLKGCIFWKIAVWMLLVQISCFTAKTCSDAEIPAEFNSKVLEAKMVDEQDSFKGKKCKTVVLNSNSMQIYFFICQN